MYRQSSHKAKAKSPQSHKAMKSFYNKSKRKSQHSPAFNQSSGKNQLRHSLNKAQLNLTLNKQQLDLTINKTQLNSTLNKPQLNLSLNRAQMQPQIKHSLMHASSKDQRYQIKSRNQQAQSRNQPRTHIKTSLTPKHNYLKPYLRSSLTPKNNNYSLKKDRQMSSGKAMDGKGKQLFVSTKYDIKPLFERKQQLAIQGKQSQQALQPKCSAVEHHNNKTNSIDNLNSLEKARHNKKSVVSTRSKCMDQATIKIQRSKDQTTIKIERHKEQLANVKAILTPDQYNKFGDRFPQNFKRIGLLGRGGFSVVWLGVHRMSKRKVAIKQTLTQNPHETHLKEIWFGSYFFDKGGEVREEFEHHIGINNICRLYSYDIQTVDSWLYYELCDESLGSSLFDLRAQSYQGERCYRIYHKELIAAMRENVDQLRTVIVQTTRALFLINSHNIVHSDLKSQNILLRIRRAEQTQGPLVRGVKLIDFGSSFLFTNLKQFSMATPEYMPPQILNYILFQNKMDYDESMLGSMGRYKNPWVVDVWSLGCIVLEIVTGVPLWMSVQTQIEDSLTRVTGLFAVRNRVFAKIIQKQMEVVSKLDYYLDHCNYSGIVVSEQIRTILKQMLDLDPQKRVAPLRILQHFGVNCQPLQIPSY